MKLSGTALLVSECFEPVVQGMFVQLFGFHRILGTDLSPFARHFQPWNKIQFRRVEFVWMPATRSGELVCYFLDHLDDRGHINSNITFCCSSANKSIAVPEGPGEHEECRLRFRAENFDHTAVFGKQ